MKCSLVNGHAPTDYKNFNEYLKNKRQQADNAMKNVGIDREKLTGGQQNYRNGIVIGCC